MNGCNETGIEPYPVTIGRHRIGPACPVFVMAEVGVNHDGSVEKALEMIDMAAEAGADAVKFQMFRASELAMVSAPTASYQKRGGAGESQTAMLAALELSDEAFAEVKKHCDNRSVVFLATPFSVADVSRLESLRVPALKIASTDLTHEPLLETAGRTGLPMILSTGASKEDEIRRCMEARARQGVLDRLVLMHCVSAYPAPLDALNLRAIATLQQAFRVPCGLSDHTMSVETGAWAVAAGACIVEKHFTYDRGASGPDHAMSLGPAQLGEYIARLRIAEASMGDGLLGMSSIESDVRQIARKSIVAAKSIPADSVLTDELLMCKRPGTGIAPLDLGRLVGRVTRVDIPRDTILSWDMLR